MFPPVFYSRLNKIIIVLILVALIFPLLSIGSDYVWPVKGIDVNVTSVLNDNRSGHPHGGIDILLFGKVGVVPIVSVADGVLMRIRT